MRRKRRITQGTVPCVVKELGLTQAALAEFAGFSVSFLSDLENGKQTAELGKALDLVNLLGLDVEFRKRDQSGCRKPVEGKTMGFLDRFKKKPASAPLTDEKKLAEVAEYRSKEHPLLRDLQVKPLGTISTYVEGKVFCKLWNTEIDVDLYDDVPIEYAEKCAEAMNAMPEELVDTICRAAKRYCLEFLDEISEDWRNEILSRLHVPVDANTAPREMLKCFEIGMLSVEPPKDPSRIGYQLSGNCDWEEEHGIEIVILDGRLVYLGEYSGESPWSVQGDESWNYAQRG